MIRQTVIVALAALAVPVSGQTADPKPAPAAKADKPVCRRIEETGSIMGGTRICHTKAQWAAIDTANNNAVTATRDTRGARGGTSQP